MDYSIRDPSGHSSEAEREIMQALDVLNAKDAAAPRHTEEQIAASLLLDAFIHVNEVSLSWDQKARQLVEEARDILREHYGKPEHAGKAKDDLRHTEAALKSIGRVYLKAHLQRLNPIQSSRARTQPGRAQERQPQPDRPEPANDNFEQRVQRYKAKREEERQRTTRDDPGHERD